MENGHAAIEFAQIDDHPDRGTTSTSPLGHHKNRVTNRPLLSLRMAVIIGICLGGMIKAILSGPGLNLSDLTVALRSVPAELGILSRPRVYEAPPNGTRGSDIFRDNADMLQVFRRQATVHQDFASLYKLELHATSHFTRDILRGQTGDHEMLREITAGFEGARIAHQLFREFADLLGGLLGRMHQRNRLMHKTLYRHEEEILTTLDLDEDTYLACFIGNTTGEGEDVFRRMRHASAEGDWRRDVTAQMELRREMLNDSAGKALGWFEKAMGGHLQRALERLRREADFEPDKRQGGPCSLSQVNLAECFAEIRSSPLEQAQHIIQSEYEQAQNVSRGLRHLWTAFEGMRAIDRRGGSVTAQAMVLREALRNMTITG